VHIPDGFLSSGVTIATWTMAAAGVGVALKAERADPHAMPAGVLGAVAAFLFATQMINLPVAPGVSGHLVGAALAAALLGPWRALIAMTVVLVIQAFLFQDGGIGALGANIVDMGLAAVAAGYALPALVARRSHSPRAFTMATVAGAFAATLAAASLAAVWLGLSGLYPLGGLLQVMLTTHSFIGVLEAALTGAVLVTVLRWRPDLVRGLPASGAVAHPGATVLGVVAIALALAAFASPFASTWPDGLAHAAARLGFANRATTAWPAPLAGYAAPFAASARWATALAGITGTAAVTGVAWIISRGLKADSHG